MAEFACAQSITQNFRNKENGTQVFYSKARVESVARKQL